MLDVLLSEISRRLLLNAMAYLCYRFVKLKYEILLRCIISVSKL